MGWENCSAEVVKNPSNHVKKEGIVEELRAEFFSQVDI